MDSFKECFETAKNPQLCTLLQQEINSLVTCVMEKTAKECFHECFKSCRGEQCEEACLGALEVAAGMAMAHMIFKRAALATALLNIDLVDAATLIFNGELKSAEEMDCPDKAAAGRVLSIAAMELFHLATESPEMREQLQSLLLLTAPALAVAHQCVGDEVFEYLETIAPLIGREMVEKIVAALEEGVALVGNTVIQFQPVLSSSQ